MTMNLRASIAGAVLAAAGVSLVPAVHAQAAPVPAMYDLVCGTLNNRPSLQSVRFMMRNYTTVLFSEQNAWDTIVTGTVEQCPEHADLLRLYAVVYGDG